ncbi:MAG: hypothetical protein AAGL11_08490 [Pseudomonadota bacterium]
MNPYSRFGLVSNTVSAAAILSVLAFVGPQFLTTLETVVGPESGSMAAAIAGSVAVMVVFWLAMTEAIFPTLFRFNAVRKLILGKYYFEGTWLQSEKGDDHERLSVIDIQPNGKTFIFSGYSLNKDLEIESNTLIEFSKMEWPFMTYKHRNSLSDGADGKRDGVGELQFEMNRAASRRYNGFVQFVRSPERLRVEGAKLTSNKEIKNLRTLQGRQKVFSKYWNLFFNVSVQDAAPVMAPVEAAPRNVVIEAKKPETPVESALERMEETAARVDRRKSSEDKDASKDGLVPRRRASDWVKKTVDASDSDLSEDTADEDTKIAKGGRK